MKLVLRILPLLALLTLVTAIATRHSQPMAWTTEPVEVGAGASLPALPQPAEHVALAGVVRGPDGDTLSGALVVLEAEEPRWTYTDAGGRFRIERAPLGPARLSVWMREHRMRAFEVEAPNEDLELALETSFEELPTLPPLETRELAGEVVPAISGRGLAGHEVLLLPVRPLSELGAPVPRRATVGADRSFRFDALLLGEYRVVVLPGWARGGTWPNLCAPRSRRLVHGRATHPGGARIDLAAGEIRGTVTDLSGDFLEGALCLLAVDALPQRVWPAAITEADGSFLFRDLPPEVYRLEVRAGSGSLSQTVEVPPGATVEADLPTLDPAGR